MITAFFHHRKKKTEQPQVPSTSAKRAVYNRREGKKTRKYFCSPVQRKLAAVKQDNSVRGQDYARDNFLQVLHVHGSPPRLERMPAPLVVLEMQKCSVIGGGGSGS